MVPIDPSRGANASASRVGRNQVFGIRVPDPHKFLRALDALPLGFNDDRAVLERGGAGGRGRAGNGDQTIESGFQIDATATDAPPRRLIEQDGRSNTGLLSITFVQLLLL